MGENLEIQGDPDDYVAVGEALKEAREKAGLGLDDVSASLRISVNYLERLERGDRTGMPGATYYMGFVRSYAKLMKLDADALCARIGRSMSDADRTPTYRSIGPVRQESGRRGLYILIGALLVLAGYGGWYLSRSGPVSEPERSGLSEINQQIDESDAVDIASIAGGETVGEFEPENDAPENDTLENDTGAGAEPDDGAASDSSADVETGRVMTLRAFADSWVKLVDADGRVVVERLMKVGEEVELTDTGGYLLSTGDAGAIALGYTGEGDTGDDETPWPPLGEDGEVLADHPVTVIAH